MTNNRDAASPDIPTNTTTAGRGEKWRQVTVTCNDWRTAERVAVEHLGPAFTTAETAGVITSWWYIRKGDTWRWRLEPAADHDEQTIDLVHRVLDPLQRAGTVRGWAPGHYEPETHAFGGDTGIRAAHTLFHADSRHLLNHLTRCNHPALNHGRELATVLTARMLTAAGQDWYEQGDIWAGIAEHRRTDSDPQPPTPATSTAVRHLITAPVDASGGPLDRAPTWPAAFQHAGRALADLGRHGHLTRGIRAVLTHHALFTFNRHGVSARNQHHLATAAKIVVFRQPYRHPHPEPSTLTPPTVACDDVTNSGSATPERTTADAADAASVEPVTRQHTDTATSDPQQLRDQLTDHLLRWGTLTSPEVEAAFRAVPRHLFLPGVDLTTAYRPKPVVTKRALDGSSVSSASSPPLVAAMLEHLQAQPGHRVLEIGAATGINAALIAELVGETGTVVTIEYDDDLATGARQALTRAGYATVRVICGDGAFGHPDQAPYDRIIVTAEAWDLVPAWWDQLTPDGRLVVPIRLHGSGLTRAIGLQRLSPTQMISHTAHVCGFVPMRGNSEHAEHGITLADGVIFGVDTNDHPDHTALARVFSYPANRQWTGIRVHDDDPAQHLDLWLATADIAPAAFGRLAVTLDARSTEIANPAMRWAGAGLYQDGAIAYIAARPITDEVNELGVITHGPGGSKLADHTAALLHHWDEQRPTQPTITVDRSDTQPAPDRPGFRTERPTAVLTVTW